MNRTQYTFEQQRAIEFFPTDPNKKHLIIEAGAGSGKTTILKERVNFLLAEKNFLPEDLIVITFTKNATSELKHRIEQIGSIQEVQEKTKFIQISTMDSFFISLVESLYPVWWDLNDALTNKIPSKITLLNEAQALLQVEKNLVKSFGEFSSEELSEIADFILAGGLESGGGFKSNQSPLQTLLFTMLNDGFLATPFSSIRISARQIHPATEKLIEKCYEVARKSYHERIIAGTFTHQDYNVFLKENLNISCPLYFKELIVDEYQDTNHIQHEILWKLVQLNNAQMTVVGDPKQSIYAFRGSHVDVFHSLLNSPNWNVISLTVNFRSTEYLLDELNLLSHLSFDWQAPDLPETFKSSFFYKEAIKKSIGHKALEPGIRAEDTERRPQVKLFEYQSAPSQTENAVRGPAKRDFNEKNIKSLGYYLKQEVAKKCFDWKNIAVLCEKNSQITKIQKAFSELGIPCSIDTEKQPGSQIKFDQEISLCLLKVLNQNDLHCSFELFELLISPLTAHSMHEVIGYFLDSEQNLNNNLQKTLKIIQSYQEKFKYHPFIAWQEARWKIAEFAVEISKSQDHILFYLSLDRFAKSFYELFKSGPIDNLEKVLSNPSKNQDSAKTSGENALAIKTVHGAKGLEWDIVCFYPANSGAERRESFSISSSWPHLDINWLSEDLKSLSYLNKKENEQFLDTDHHYDSEKDKVIWFSDLRNTLEKNFERQRVFYTAFTRPRKELIFVHPERHSASSGLKIDKKFDFSNYIKNFEQDIYLKYAYLAKENKANATHVHFSELPSIDTLSNDNSNLQPDVEINLEKLHIIPNTNNNESKTDDENSSIIEIISTPLAILQQKQKIRRASHRGIVLHAKAENRQFESHIILPDLYSNSVTSWNEFEISNVTDIQSQTIQRKVIDLLLLFKKSEFLSVYKKLSTNCAYINWDIDNNSDYVFLIVDFKTGKITQSGIDQVSEYVLLIKELSSSGWFIKFFSPSAIPNIVSCLLQTS